MSTKTDELLQEIQWLSCEEKMVLYKELLQQIATPLWNPKELFDDWDDMGVDKAYEKKFFVD